MGSQRVRLDWATEHITCPSHSACRHGVPGCNQTQVAKLRALYVLTVQGLGRVDNPVSSGELDLYSGWELQLHVPTRNSSPPPGLTRKSSILRSSNHPPRPDDFVVQSFPASGSFPVSQIFASSIGQSIGASASASVLPMNILCWFPLGLTGLISLLYTVVYICRSQSPNSSHPSPFSLGIHTFVFYVYSALFLMPFYVNSLFWSTQLPLWVGRSSPPDRPGSKGSQSQWLSPSGSMCVWIWNQVPPPFYQDPPLSHSQKTAHCRARALECPGRAELALSVLQQQVTLERLPSLLSIMLMENCDHTSWDRKQTWICFMTWEVLDEYVIVTVTVIARILRELLLFHATAKKCFFLSVFPELQTKN